MQPSCQLKHIVSKLTLIVCIVLNLIILMSGCSSEEATEMNMESGEKQIAADTISNWFENHEKREFHVDDSLTTVGNDNVYVVEVSGILQDRTYPIDTFAINVQNEKIFFRTSDSNQFEEFSDRPKFACEDSLDGKYRAESLGMTNEGISGQSVLKEMRVISCETGEVLWNAPGFVNNRFLWSPDSKYLAIQYSG